MNFSLINVIMVALLIACIVAGVVLYRHLTAQVNAADGFDGVNGYGEPGQANSGDVLVDVGEQHVSK